MNQHPYPRQNPSSDLQIFWRLLKLFSPYWRWMLLGILLSLITVIANVGLLALAAWFITAMAIAGVAQVDMNYFTPAASIRGLSIARAISRYAERVVTHEATFQLLAQLRVWFYEQLEPLAPAALQNYHSGDLLSRIRADIDTLENVYLRILSPFTIALLGTSIFVLFLTRYSTAIALVVLILLIIAGIITPLMINRYSRRPSERLIETSAELRAVTIDNMQGMGELLIYGGDQKQSEKLRQLSNKLLDDQTKISKYTEVSQATLGFCANLAMLLTLILAIPLVTAEAISPANLTMLTLFTLACFETIIPLPLAFQALPETLKVARRIFEIADTPPPIKEPSTRSPIPKTYDITLENISFRYQNSTKTIFDDFSLKIPHGKKIAIIGGSGSGKSTLINLLLRFWEPQSGEIRLGSYKLTDYKSDDLRQHFSVVSQHSHIFNSTLRSNLLLAKLDASDEELVNVCKIAQIHDFILSQPDTYETWVGEAGLKLSGGQIRRLSIARALLKDAPILILDEPGEGLDTKTEKALLAAVIKQSENKTLILITHKKAGLQAMDKIIDLEAYNANSASF